MNPFEKYILMQLKEAHRPMTGTLLAELNGRPQTTVRYYLRRLEQMQQVSRPYGRKGGWVAI